MASTIDYSTLNWVKEEIDETMKQARHALEEYVEDQEDATQLRFCVTYIHQVYGTLQMVELYGAALFAEEMELLIQALLSNDVTQKDDAHEVLMRAIIQLPDYLEKIQRGMKDNPLILMPIMNDLRTARGATLLSESALFSPDLENAEMIAVDRSDDLFGVDPKILAKKLRPLFQVGLLGWYRDNNTTESLNKLRKALGQLEQVCSHEEVIRLWWVAKGIVEALLNDGLNGSITLKLLLGQADREIKRLIDMGEQGLVDDPSEELLKNLLYYVAQAKPVTQRLEEIKLKYSLPVSMASEKEVESARESLSSPNAQLMETVSIAISEDLSRVKDALDLLLRSDDRDMSSLEPLVDVLQKMADTLGMLGMGVPRKVIQEQVGVINSLVSGELAPDESRLMEIAGALLFVESSLVGMVESSHAEEELAQSGESATADNMLADGEMRQIQDTVFKEIIVEISKAKDAIVAFLDAPMDFNQLKVVPDLFTNARGGMKIMGMERLADVIDGAAEYIDGKLEENAPAPGQAELDNIADVISSIEYYLEAVRENRSGTDAIIDVAYQSLEKLGYKRDQALVSDAEKEIEIPEVIEEVEIEVTAPEVIEVAVETPEPEAELESEVEELESSNPEEEIVLQEPESEIESETEAVSEPDTKPTRITKRTIELPEDIDEDILEIFIEESEEVYSEVQTNLPVWKEDQQNTDALGTIRRAFHTLKGSGRLVGAESIGEFAWSIENLLNKVLEGDILPSAAIFTHLDNAVGVLPDLIAELKGEASGDVDVHGIINRSEELIRQGNDAIEALEPEEILIEEAEQSSDRIVADIPAAEPEQADIIRVMDPVLYEIFCKESEGHLTSIKEFIDSVEKADNENVQVSDALIRALHTLHGSARMAGADDIAEVAGGFEQYVKILHENETAINADMITLLRQGVSAIEDLLTLINKVGEPETDIQKTLNDIALCHKLEVEKQDERVSQEREVAEQQQNLESEAKEEETSDEQAFDQEILDVFLEEGSEITDASEVIMQRLASDPQDSEAIAELQRELHTLKGGARMAGITAIGDLSHAFESVLTAVVEEGLSVSSQMVDVMHRSVDELMKMLNEVRQHKEPTAADPLVSELETLLKGGETSEDIKDSGLTVESEIETDAEIEIEVEDDLQESADVINFPVSEQEDDAETPEKPSVSTETVLDEIATEEDVDELEEEGPVVIPPPLQPVQHVSASKSNAEMIRVRSDLLDDLVNNAGEVSIYRSRLEQQIAAFKYNLVEMDQTVFRLREQLRKLEIETEAQVLFRHEQEIEKNAKFDPLEMDRYSTMQQLSRALMETTADIGSIQNLMDNLVRESETLMIQQARVNTDLQEGLMKTRMVAFSGLVPRLQRIVRQTCKELGKQAQLTVSGEGGELDRNVLERVTAPLEHMLRNALSHGIEKPNQRKSAGKKPAGQIDLSVLREGSEIVLRIEDDGAGFNLDAIREKALERGLLDENANLSDNDIMQFVLESGLSTAEQVTQISGRGVGMDVVNSEIKQLGGSLAISSEQGKGSVFIIRLPLTLALNHALLVKVSDEVYAVPLTSIEGIVRMSHDDLLAYQSDPDKLYQYSGSDYQVQRLGRILHPEHDGGAHDGLSPVLLVRAGDHKTALQVDALLGSREIVVKSVGPQLSTLRGVSGATILGDGRVVLILDAGSIIRLSASLRHSEFKPSVAEVEQDRKLNVMVVDDSITVRKVTTRLLERNDMNVITAKDGVDAIATLQDHIPDIMLLDIEMPRMDGFELATHMRNEARLKEIPIIMITSRTGEKHRQRAEEIGVQRYLGKPFQEHDLLDNINSVIEEIHGHA